ncbi:interleukin-31 receptor subunit alpha [Pelobates cultripes]|uniref:Interleukin-31 receptor subunit alpha n=1 Tax=Pelobates cultripes TaxID=61616 RepID=A0AAD1SDH9_PELCU|nr:interleukin-31 receptor subunit alpha [Pelobates cultripes]
MAAGELHPGEGCLKTLSVQTWKGIMPCYFLGIGGTITRHRMSPPGDPAPSHPQAIQPDADHSIERRTVKPSGITLGYRIKWFPTDWTFLQRTETTILNEMTIHLSGEAYMVSVVSYNSAGASPEAVLRIPAVAEQTRSLVNYIQIVKWGENLTVKWNVTEDRIDRFLVEWCIAYETKVCDIHWEYLENATGWTTQTGMFEPYKCYKISIYPLLGDRVEASSSLYFYFKEGAPQHGPIVIPQSPSKTEVTLKWANIPVDDRNGFIRNFTIVYQPLNGMESAVTVDCNIHEYTLRSLEPGTQYSAYVVASTQIGSTSGNLVHFSTLKYNKDDIVRYGGMGLVLLLFLVFGIIYAHKKHKQVQLKGYFDIIKPFAIFKDVSIVRLL